MGSSPRIWPIEPFERLVELRGKPVGVIARDNGVDDYRADRLADFYRQGVKDRLLTLTAMDALAIEAFGLHPLNIYGLDYFSDKYDTGRVLKPCKDCGGPKTFGDGMRCSECMEKRRWCACGCGEPVAPGGKARYASRNHSQNYRRRAA